MYDIIVVGAGFAGSVFARKMADAGKKVLIIEKRSHIGGNAYDEEIDNITIHTYGPHIFHTNKKEVFDFLSVFSDWYKYEHRVLGKIDGELVPIPFNFKSIETLFPSREANELKELLLTSFGENKRISIFDLLNHPTSKLKELGQYIYEKVFAHYTAKQWGIPIEQIDKSTINRVPIVVGYDDRYFQDTIQEMPSGGFTELFSNLLDHPNIEIELNCEARNKINLDFSTNTIYFDEKEFPGLLFFTGAVDEFLDYKFGVLPYRSLELAFEHIDKTYFQPGAVVNYPNEELFTRITEFKHFFPHKETVGHTTILKEYPLQFDKEFLSDPYYPIINKENEQMYNNYIKLLEPFGNIVLCGRLAEYKYYNMDDVVARSLSLADKLIN